MKQLFQICVDILNWLAACLGISYEEANIWVFVIIHPTLTAILLILAIYQRGLIRGMKKSKH